MTTVRSMLQTVPTKACDATVCASYTCVGKVLERLIQLQTAQLAKSSRPAQQHQILFILFMVAPGIFDLFLW